jgi:creatinine amidohydrolase
MRKAYIADMSWEEFRDAVDQAAIVLIPLGSTELEGLHLPLGVDTIVAEGVAARLTEEEGVLVGPALPIGYSKWFNPFPGTISLEHETLTRVLRDYCTAMIRHGVRRLVFLNSHRGNNSCVEVVAQSLILEQPVSMGMINIWKLANDLIAGTDLIEEGRFTHAGEIMTSVVMALKPETVIASKMKADRLTSPRGSTFTVKSSLGDTQFEGSVQTFFQDIRTITATGIMGDPQAATPEKGRALLDLIVDYARAYLRELRRVPLPAQPEKEA